MYLHLNCDSHPMIGWYYFSQLGHLCHWYDTFVIDVTSFVIDITSLSLLRFFVSFDIVCCLYNLVSDLACVANLKDDFVSSSLGFQIIR